MTPEPAACTAESQPEARAAVTVANPGGFYVVGIGASAGGLSALRTLFSRLPPAPGVAFVVVVHLSPEHKSHLTQLLQPCTPMPVRQVTETIALERNHVYVIPPNANLNTIDTHLRLSELEERRIERAPIDHFLRTLAATHGDSAVGVILTGTGSDGALGLRQIKEQDGLTIVQDPDEAEYDGMPRSAIATGTVDLIVPLRDIADEILRFCSTRPRLAIPDGDEAIAADEGAVLERIVGELRVRTGRELAMYKHATLLKRIRRRMRLRHVETLSAYLEVLRSRPEEAQALYNDLQLTVTEFFREPEVFQLLECDILPSLLDRKRGPRDRLRIWSIGCSTGEEAYSIAMLLLEQTAGRGAPAQLQVFASDMAESALRAAREGVYPLEVSATVSPERLERFFVKEVGHYRVRREVRDLVVFVAHDLFTDPPYAHLDLIVCRSLLRDVQLAIRRGVLSLFAYALEPQGLLIVGDRDVVDDPHFVAGGGNERLYRRVSGPREAAILPPAMRPFGRSLLHGERPAVVRTFHGATYDPAVLYRAAMERYAPPSVLIDAENIVIHYSAHASPYMLIPGGELTHDVIKLAREPVRSRLLAGIAAVRRDGKSWSSAPFAAPAAGEPRRIILRIDPVLTPDDSGLLLVVFDEQRAAELPAEGTGVSATAAVVAQLQAELDETRRRLEDLFAAQRRPDDRGGRSAASLELLRANDELSAVLETLASSKEELQAVNEELITVGDENRRRLDELARISSDLRHLLESTGIATLFVDRALRIVRFTPKLAELFNVRPADVGRPLSDLTHELSYDELETDAQRVLADLVTVDREVASSKGRWYLSRMLPYRIAAHRVEGVVLTFIDITDRKRIEERLRDADRRKDEFLAVLAHELRNPLAPISSGIAILKAAGGDRRIVDQVSTTMARQMRQLVRLVDDLLEVSRISGGKLYLRKSPVRLADVVRDAVASARPLIESTPLELIVNEPAEPIIVDADAVRLTQVIANLLNNAVRYTPGGGRIELSVRREGAEALVSVRDSGSGIAPDIMDHIFEMFYQGDSERFPRPGLGIGLTLAKTLMEMHGGTITVASDGADRGSTFTLRLPLPTEASSLPLEQDEPDAGPASGRRVLIVDDNADAAQTLCLLVETLGASEVRTAASGSRALEMAAEMRPDLVLLDLTMPGMDGFEVARRMRQAPWGRSLLLVALTGWGQEEHRRRATEAGFDRHLTKPADVEALRAVLDERRPAERGA